MGSMINDAGCIRQIITKIAMTKAAFNKQKTLHTKIKVKKAKCSRYRPGVAQGVSRGIALLFHDRGTRWG